MSTKHSSSWWMGIPVCVRGYQEQHRSSSDFRAMGLLRSLSTQNVTRALAA
ncbi:hypothetical protein ACYRY4_004071 [Yersinia enterocolitica]